jgi:predicted nucleic acid-binding protein
VAALFDTTVAVLLLRRKPNPDAAALLRAARGEIENGSAMLPAVAVSELIVGERKPEQAQRLLEALTRIPTAILAVEAANSAGSMGAFLRQVGSPVPFPDLLIAATAVWLDVPLLTWDGDYSRARTAALKSRSAHPGRDLWRRLELHGASRAV